MRATQRKLTRRLFLRASAKAVASCLPLLCGCSATSTSYVTRFPRPQPTPPQQSPSTGQIRLRTGHEIVVAGQLFSIGRRVILWDEPEGMDGYTGRGKEQVEPDGGKAAYRPQPFGPRVPGRLNLSISELRELIDQLVIHYDAAGWSRRCFTILEKRGLSVHLLLDLDGTLYQTLDLAECAWHATKANRRSIGIEIANIGAYPPSQAQILNQWYYKAPDGTVQMRWPMPVKKAPLYNPNYIPRPHRQFPIQGTVHGQLLVQYDFTTEQYQTLVYLVAALCRIFPKLRCTWPVDSKGRPITTVLAPERFATYSGILGHFHIDQSKVDPGPAFQWRLVLEQSMARLTGLELPMKINTTA